MSIKRYDVGMTEETNNRTGFYASYPRVYEAEKGRYVEYADYARLKAERVHDINQIGGLQQELARLRASSFVTAVPVEQYERVVKAGDAVCESPYLWEDDPAVIAWRAAKEGKPSV